MSASSSSSSHPLPDKQEEEESEGEIPEPKPEPEPFLETRESRGTPPNARPRGEWRIRVKREGVLRTRNMIPKLERMGLISTMDSAVGTGIDENHQGWDEMFVSKRTFWQIPSGLFLFTLQPTRHSSHPGSPVSSRPGSPIRTDFDSSSSPSPLPQTYPHLTTRSRMHICTASRAFSPTHARRRARGFCACCPCLHISRVKAAVSCHTSGML